MQNKRMQIKLISNITKMLRLTVNATKIKNSVLLNIDFTLKVLSQMGLFLSNAQPAFTCSKLTIEALERGVKYVQS